MRRLYSRLPWLILAVTLCQPIESRASSPSGIIVRVEEDWVLRVGVPDPNSHAPQVSMAMSTGSSPWMATFELNHQTEPYYVAGGVHMQLWNGSTLVTNNGWGDFACIDRNEDEIHWTQVMQVEEGRVAFGIRNGSGLSWGAFGGESFQVADVAEVYDLNSYSPDSSLENSGISLAGNRVTELTLKCVRYRMADGSVTEQVINRSAQ